MQEIVTDAGWCWFGDPRALWHQGQLYYAWIDSKARVWVGQTDTATWTRRRFLLQQDAVIDDHGNPSLLIRGDRVCVFWSGHSGATMRYRIATNIHSIESFGAVITASHGNTTGANGFTYPNPVPMSHDGALHLFWRGGNFQPTYSKSANMGGNQWTPAKHLFSVASGQRPYVKVIGDGAGKIHFAMTDGHPHNVATSLYYACWDLPSNTFKRANGSTIGAFGAGPMPVASLDRFYDGSGSNPRAWIHDLKVDVSGSPHAVFAVLPSREVQEYWSAKHDGTAWTVGKIADAGGTIAQDGERFYTGGIALDPYDLDTVTLSRPSGAQGLHQIEQWQRGDCGTCWQQAAVVSDDGQQNVRPFYVRGAQPGMNWRLMWLRGTYGDFLNFGPLRLVGAP